MGAACLERHGIPAPWREARWLLAHVLRVSVSNLVLHPERELDERRWRRFRRLLERRARGEPLAYVTRIAEFMGRPFLVGRSVLVPRPETEVLVRVVAEHLRDRPPPVTLADLGTGSGVVAVCLALARRDALVHAVDISRAALGVARRNARCHGVAERVILHWGDLCRPLEEAGLRGRLAAVAANPPYIGRCDLAVVEEGVRRYEPLVALVAGEDGLAVLRRLAAEAPSFLEPGGLLAVEVGLGQAGAVADLLRGAGLAAVRCWRDDGGVERVVSGRKEGGGGDGAGP